MGPRSHGFGFLWARTVLQCPEEMPDAPQELGLVGSPGMRHKTKFSLDVQLRKTNARTGKAIPLLTPGAAGLCCRACVGSHDHRQRSQSIPRQAQPGAVGSDSASQVAAAVSQGSPPPTAAVLWLTGPSVSPAGTVTVLAPSQPWHRGEQPEHGALLCRVFPGSFELSSPWLPLLYLCLCRVHRLLLYFQR